MTELPRAEFLWAPGFAETIAEIANNWAHLEYAMNKSIWLLSGLSAESGACITSQIFTLNGRISAVKSLLELHGANKIIKRVNKFAESVRSATEERNRAIHDMWLMDPDDPLSMARMEITSPGKLRFEPKSYDLSKLQSELANIKKSRREAFLIKNEIKALPTLPETPFSTRDPIRSL